MAFAYGTVQKNFKLHKSRSILILVIVAISFYAAGMLSRSAYASYNTNQLDKACRSYVDLVLAGELDKAYDQSADTIKENQQRDIYKEVLGKLKTDKPEFNSELEDIRIIDGKSGACAINVGGLPAAEGERTDGTFNMGAVKEGSGWKVGSLSVE